MTTTTSTTSSSTNPASSILTTLGSGSGIDTASLIDQLVDAEFAAKNSAITAKSDKLTAQVSAVSDLKSGISGFDSALKSLILTGSLSTQPTSSNTGVVKVSALTGATVSGLSGTVEVRQLAAAQSASVAPVADRTAAIGTGKLTLTFGTATVDEDGRMTDFTAGGGTPIDITIDSSNSSLDGIAAAINAKGAGITASILSDGDGARLVLKSATGASQAFTLTATEDEGAEGLASLDIGPGATNSTIGTAASDAIVAIDGVAVHRTTNSILDLVPGVRLDLVSASPGTRVSLGMDSPAAALSQAVSDVVETYNGLLATVTAATDPITGALKSDSAAKQLLRQLQTLTTQALVASTGSGAPTTLASLGVATNRDGTLTLDSAKLTTMLNNYPASVEAMFKAGSGLSAALTTISANATSTVYGLGASETTYTKAQTELTDEQTKAAADAETLRTRMTQQFAAMDAKVAAYKSTQSFLTAQIDAWNKSDN